jgi:8-oxo-dGTP diphosphatase
MSEKESPSVMVDAVVIENEKLLLVTRKKDPFKGFLTFPGGKVDEGEKVEDAVKRELREETSLDIDPTDILGVYSDPSRDPRGHRISVTFIAKVISGEAKPSSDAESIEWLSVNEIKELGFDHNKILKDYQIWRSAKGTFWSSKS